MAFDRKKLEDEVWEKIFEMQPKPSRNYNIVYTQEWKDDIKKLRRKVKLLGKVRDCLYMEIDSLENPLAGYPDMDIN
jgi:hypothetical protein